MRLFDVVLFAHIAALLGGFASAMILHTAQWGAGRATTVGELRGWVRVIRRFLRLFPFFLLLLFVLGAWLLHLSRSSDEVFLRADGWVVTAVGAVVILGAVAGGVLNPWAKKLSARVDAAPEGPVSPELRALVLNPVIWTLAHLNTGLALATAFTMTTKPALGGALACLAVGAGLGALIGNLAARRAVSASA